MTGGVFMEFILILKIQLHNVEVTHHISTAVAFKNEKRYSVEDF